MASGVGLWWPLGFAVLVILQSAGVSPLPAREFSALHSADVLPLRNVLSTPRAASLLTRLGLHDVDWSHPDLVRKGNFQDVDADQYNRVSAGDPQYEDAANYRGGSPATNGASPHPLIYSSESLPELYWKLLRSSYGNLQWLTGITCRANRRVREIGTLYNSTHPQLPVPRLYKELRTLFKKLHAGNASSVIGVVVDTALSWIQPLRLFIIPRESLTAAAAGGEFIQNGKEITDESDQATRNAVERRKRRDISSDIISLSQKIGETFVLNTRPFVLPALQKIYFVVGKVRDFEKNTSLPLRDAMTELSELFLLGGFGPIISLGRVVYPMIESLLPLYTPSESQGINSSMLNFRCGTYLPDFDSLSLDSLETSNGSAFVNILSIFPHNNRTRRELVSAFEKFLKFNIGLGDGFLKWLNKGIQKAKEVNENWTNVYPTFSIEYLLEDLHQVVKNLVEFEFPTPLNKIFQFLKILLDRVGPIRVRRETDFNVARNSDRGLYRSKRQAEKVFTDYLKYLSASESPIMENTNLIHRESPAVKKLTEEGQRVVENSIYAQLKRNDRPEVLVSDTFGAGSPSNERTRTPFNNNDMAMRQLLYSRLISGRPPNGSRSPYRKTTDNFSMYKMQQINEVVISVMQRVLEKISYMLGRIAEVLRGISKSISVFPHSYVLKIWERILEKVERFVHLLPTSEMSYFNMDESGDRSRRKRMIVPIFNIITLITADVTNALLTWAKSAVEKLEPYLKTLHNPYEAFSFSWLLGELRNLWGSLKVIDLPSPFEVLMKMARRFFDIFTTQLQSEWISRGSRDNNREKRDIATMLRSPKYNQLAIPVQREVAEVLPSSYSANKRISSSQEICTPIEQTTENQSFDYHSRTHLLIPAANLVLGQIYTALQRILLTLREAESAVFTMNKFWMLNSENMSPVDELRQLVKVIEVTKIASSNIVLPAPEEVTPISGSNTGSTLDTTMHIPSELPQNTESTGFVAREILDENKPETVNSLIETPMEDVSQS